MQNSAPTACQLLHTLCDVDVDQLAQGITGWEQTYTQTATGRFHGQLMELLLGNTQIFIESSSHALQQICKIPTHSVWFGVPEQGTQLGKIDGSPICENMLAVHAGDGDFQLSTPNNFDFFGIVIDKEALQFWLAHMVETELPTAAFDRGLLCVSSAHLSLLRNQLRYALQFANLSTEIALNATQDTVEQVMSLLSQTLVPWKSLPRDSVTAQHARKMVRRMQDYVRANDDRNITVQELCMQLGTSRRALQDCCRKLLDISPKAYLHAYKLNAVRRELHRTNSQWKTVSDVATQYGFWHLGQFAADYRRLFGELPSTSLQQRNSLKNANF